MPRKKASEDLQEKIIICIQDKDVVSDLKKMQKMLLDQYKVAYEGLKDDPNVSDITGDAKRIVFKKYNDSSKSAAYVGTYNLARSFLAGVVGKDADTTEPAGFRDIHIAKREIGGALAAFGDKTALSNGVKGANPILKALAQELEINTEGMVAVLRGAAEQAGITFGKTSSRSK